MYTMTRNLMARTTKKALHNITFLYNVQYIDSGVSNEEQVNPTRHEDVSVQTDVQMSINILSWSFHSYSLDVNNIDI